MAEAGPPNMSTFAAMNFRFQKFVRPKDTTAERLRRDKNTKLGAILEGAKVQKFYEEVLSSEPTVNKRDNSQGQKRHSDQKKRVERPRKFLRCNPTFQADCSEPSFENTQRAFRAAQENNVNVLQDLFSRETKLGECRDSYNWTLLMVAACGNAIDVVKFLLSQDKVDCRAVESRGHNAFQMAKKRGFLEVAKLIESKYSQTDKKTVREIHVATSKPLDSGSPSECELCRQKFKNESGRATHLSSMVHQFNETRAQIESDTLRPHFVIPEANRGFQIMLGSGWDKRGLGPTGSGKLYPVRTALKRDRHGLGMASEDGSKKQELKITHFNANDPSSVAEPSARKERKKTLSKKHKARQLTKERAKEVNFRREFMFD